MGCNKEQHREQLILQYKTKTVIEMAKILMQESVFTKANASVEGDILNSAVFESLIMIDIVPEL